MRRLTTAESNRKTETVLPEGLSCTAESHGAAQASTSRIMEKLGDWETLQEIVCQRVRAIQLQLQLDSEIPNVYILSGRIT